jgi:pyridine nucleotide-disulfide oxidoreductase family protein
VKHLVLLGGGHAHVHVLRAFAEQPLPSARVTFVSPHEALVYSGMVPGMVAGHYQPEDCSIPLLPLAQRARADFVQAAATGVDAAAKTVTLTTGESIDYDVLSIDVGGTVDRDAIPGAREHALFVRPMELFARLWTDLLALAQEKTLSVVMIGGGAGGVELAMALQHRLGDRARVSLLTGGGPVLPDYPASVQARGARALKRCGVTLFEDVCSRIAAGHVVLGRGVRLSCDAPVVAIGNSAPIWLRNSGLALDGQGFVATGPTLQCTLHPDVFAAGDAATRIDAPHAKSGVYAVRSGPPLALNLRRAVSGGVLEPHVPQPRSLNLLSCGRRYAIASWGSWSAEGRWVWWWKNRIDRGFVRRFKA